MDLVTFETAKHLRKHKSIGNQVHVNWNILKAKYCSNNTNLFSSF